MSTPSNTAQRLSHLHLSDSEHPSWSEAFTPATRCEQIDEDLFAARSVSSLLIAIVVFGVSLGTLAVVLATLL